MRLRSARFTFYATLVALSGCGGGSSSLDNSTPELVAKCMLAAMIKADSKTIDALNRSEPGGWTTNGLLEQANHWKVVGSEIAAYRFRKTADNKYEFVDEKRGVTVDMELILADGRYYAAKCGARHVERPAALHAPRVDAEEAGKRAIEMFDADKDGKIDGEELSKCPGLKAAMSKLDPEGTGELTAAMIAARIRAWQDSRLARMSLRCMVTRQGQPLAGAEVRFVPERFLGDDMKTAVATTDQNGVAMLSIPGTEGPPGVPVGFYRVEINKAGENIPAKYNTETVLGQEVAVDADGVRQGITFDLDY